MFDFHQSRVKLDSLSYQVFFSFYASSNSFSPSFFQNLLISFPATFACPYHSLKESSNSLEDSITIENKKLLKPLAMSALKEFGYERTQKEFVLAWNHLYTGSVFAMRSNFSNSRLEKSYMKGIVDEHAQFLFRNQTLPS